MKKILIITTSLHSHSNSTQLAQAFSKGATEAGNDVETISLRGKDIRFCRGCLACSKTQQCVIKDDAPDIVEKMRQADTIVFATPIYYYEMAGQMKTLLDRANPLYNADYHFRDIYLLTTAAENEETTPHRAQIGLEGWIACFDKSYLAGHIFAGGVADMGDINDHPALHKAYLLGHSITNK